METVQQNVSQNTPNFSAPVGQLKTNRGLAKYILLGIITLGIYPIVVMSSISSDINIIAGRYDGKRTMHYCLYHNLSSRIGNELRRRNISYQFGAGSYWGWSILGSLIVVGPFIYIYKLLKAMNLLSSHYNVNG